MGMVSYQESVREQMGANPNPSGLKAPGKLLETNAGFIPSFSKQAGYFAYIQENPK